MITLKKNKLVRVISAAVIMTFIWQQIAWAGGGYVALPAENDRNQTGFLSPQRLQEAQARQEALIGRLNDLLDRKLSCGEEEEDEGEWHLERKAPSGVQAAAIVPQSSEETIQGQGAAFSVTTENGDVIHYLGSEITRVECADGTIIEDIELDEEGDIYGALIKYPDTTVIAVEYGRPVCLIAPDGTVVHYDSEGRVEYIVSPDGIVSDYAYEFDGAGNITRTIVTDPDSTCEYGADSKLAGVTRSDGTVIEYENGVITRITKQDGSQFIFIKEEASGQVTARLHQYVDTDGLIYKVSASEESAFEVIDRDLVSTQDYYYTGQPKSHSQDPYVRSYITLNKDRGYNSSDLKASYYKYNERNITLSLGISGNTPYINFYKYDYATKDSTSDNRCFNEIALEYDIEYVQEMLWEAGKVNVYLYRKGDQRPAEALCTLDEADWDPRFSLNANNASITIDEASNVIFDNTSRTVSLKNKQLLEKDLSYIAEISFDDTSSYKKLFFKADGRTQDSYEYFQFSWSGSNLYMYEYKYNYTTRERVSSNSSVSGIPLNRGSTYIVEAVFDAGSERSHIYIYEKGEERPSEAVCVVEGVNWNPKVYASVSGGDAQADLYEGVNSGERAISPDDEIIKENCGFIEAMYDSSGSITQIVSPDGSGIFFDADGFVSKALDAEGVETDYEFAMSKLGHVVRSTILRKDVKRQYDNCGKLVELELADKQKFIYEDDQIKQVTDPSGITYLYEAGDLKELVKEDGARFEFDGEGRISTAVKADGRIFEYSYGASADGSAVTRVKDTATDDVRIYIDDKLDTIERSDGSAVEHFYDDGDLSRVDIKKHGRLINSYTYIYDDGRTILTDLGGNEKVYDAEGRLARYTDNTGKAYVYEYEGSRAVATIKSLRASDGSVINYNTPDISEILSPAGIVLKDPVFDGEGNLTDTDIILSDGMQRGLSVSGAFSQFTDDIGQRFIFKDDRLIEIATDQDIVRLAGFEDNPFDDGLDYYDTCDIPSRQDANFRPQTYYDSRGITDITRNGAELELAAHLIPGDRNYSKGEIMLDLRYGVSSIGYTEPLDLRGKEVSFLFKAPEGFVSDESKPPSVSVFVKDSGWKSQYGIPVKVTKEDQWYRVSLRPSENLLDGGWIDDGFDPSAVIMLGFKVQVDRGEQYDGPLYVRHGNDPGVEDYIDNPSLVDFARILPYFKSLSDKVVLSENREYITGGDIASIFNAPPAENPNAGVSLDSADWQPQQYIWSQGVKAIRKDTLNDQWAVDLELDSYSSFIKDGEMTLDLKYDLPSITWQGPVDMTGKELSFLVKAPDGFILSGDKPNWVQVFAKDKDYKCQYGQGVKITEAGEWFRVTLSPQEGWINGGYTQGGFDPTAIEHIGLKFASEWGTGFTYSGQVYVRTDTGEDVFENSTPKVMLDMKALEKYMSSNGITLTQDDIAYVRDRVPDFRLDKNFAHKIYYEHGKIRTEERPNGARVRYHHNGKVKSLEGPQGETLVEYRYDEDWGLTNVLMKDSREKLGEAVASLKSDLARRRQDALDELANQEDETRTALGDEVKKSKDLIDRNYSDLVSQANGFGITITREVIGGVAMDIPTSDGSSVEILVGGEVKYTPSSTGNGAGEACDNLAKAENDLNAQGYEAWEKINADVAGVEQQIEDETANGLDQITQEEDKALEEIGGSESITLAQQYYKDVLGRDASEDELLYWKERGEVLRAAPSATELINHIKDLDEYKAKEADKDYSIQKISEFLNNYLDASEAQRISLLEALGLDHGEIVPVTEEAVDNAVRYLDSQTLHFGGSAVATLKGLLSDRGIDIEKKDIAATAILIDILTGVIDTQSKGNVKISMYALSKVAQVEGAVLYGQNVSLDALSGIVSSGRAIAHTDGDHYVFIKDVGADSVTYLETSVGSAGSEVTVTKDEFVKKWEGNILSYERDPQARLLSADDMKRITGAGWWKDFWRSVTNFFRKAVDVVVNVVKAIINIPAQICKDISEGNWAGALVSIGGIALSFALATPAFTSFISGVVGQVSSALGGIVSNIANGALGTAIGAIVQPIKMFASGVIGVVKNIISSPFIKGLTEGLTAIGETLGLVGEAGKGLAGFVTSAYRTAVDIGISSAITQNLNSDPVLGAFLSTALIGGLKGQNVLSSGLLGATIQGVEELGEELDIDPDLTHILSIASGQLVDATLAKEMSADELTDYLRKEFAPRLAGELSYVGLQKAGESLGIDPRISSLAGIGIRSALRVGFSDGQDPGAIWSAAMTGLARGATSIGLEWGAQSLGLSPLIASLSSAAIAGGVEALLEGRNPVEGIFDAYFKAGTGLLTLGGSGATSWEQAAYIAQVLDFSQIIQEEGIAEAIETYATGFLHQTTINEIWKQGGIAQMLISPSQVEITTNAKGEEVKRVYTSKITSEADKTTSNYLDFSPNDDRLMGYREGNIITHCDFVMGPDGATKLRNGERELLGPDGTKMIEIIKNFNLTRLEYYDDSGQCIGWYIPADGTSSIKVGADGKVSDGKFVSLVTDYDVSVQDGQVVDMNLERGYVFSEEQRANLTNAGVEEAVLSQFKEVVSIAKGVLQYFVIPPDTPIFDISKDEGKAWLDSLEADGKAFWQGVYNLTREVVAGDPLPQISSDSVYPFANIDLNLPLPGRSEAIIAGLDTLYLISGGIVNTPSSPGSLLSSNSTWSRNTGYSAQLFADSFDAGCKFVFGGGANTDGLTPLERESFYNLLDTEQVVGVGNSADSVSIAKSWLIPDAEKAEHYFLIAPRISPEDVQEYMRIGGISPDKLTIVEVVGDYPQLPLWTNNFSAYKDSDGNKKWNYVKIVDGPGVGLWWSSHKVPVRGMLEGGLYTVEVNGVVEKNVTLSDIYKKRIN
ncbi:hypothetical protein ACFL42_00540 [Candidatus Omnitrophota bacterium]